MAVEATGTQLVGEGGSRFGQFAGQVGGESIGRRDVAYSVTSQLAHWFTSQAPLGLSLNGGMRRPQRSGLSVDGPGRFIAKEVSDHGGQQESQAGMHRRHGHHVVRPGEPGRAGICHYHGCRLVRPVDGHLFSHVVGCGTD